jgi:hypothetical protein
VHPTTGVIEMKRLWAVIMPFLSNPKTAKYVAWLVVFISFQVFFL